MSTGTMPPPGGGTGTGGGAAVTRGPLRGAGTLPEGAGAPARARRRRWVWLFLLGWLAQVAVRVWLASGQTMPIAIPDEAGYLFAARVMTGGADADLSYGTVYRGGYPLLLMPAYWLADDPVTVYRCALVINALVSAAMLPLAYLLLRALRVRPRWSYVFGHVTALLPGVVFYSEFVLTDAVLPVVLLGWLLLVHAWLKAPYTKGERPSRRVALYGVGASLLVAFAYTSHTRGAIFLVVHGALLAVAVACRWRHWRGAALAALVAGAGTAAGTVLNHSLLPHLYPDGDNNLGGNLARRLTTSGGLGWTLSLGTGQVWYQCVATGGLAAVGLAAVGFAAARRGTPGRLRALALAILAIVAGIAFATSGALPDEYRVGNYVYGRYLACVTPILFAVGVAVLLRASRRTLLSAVAAAVAVTVLAASVVRWYAGDRLARYTFTRYDFPETSFLTWDWSSFRLWDATLAGLVLLGLAVLTTLTRRRWGPLVLAGLLATVALAMSYTATDRIARPSVRSTTAYTDIRGSADLEHTRSIALDWNVPWTVRLSHYYWAWWGDGSLFNARWTKPPQDVDMVVLHWPKRVPPEASWPHGAPDGWKVVDSRRSPEGDWVAFVNCSALGAGPGGPSFHGPCGDR
ncbi:hypothetical protein [Actinomadura sp. NEAU-AAG7]|uniref:hypothetical protein n=1 Tax=Actinomadura sp. NEAU-AAG7 TaxID=2839640 RepID=UPI001BE4B3C6|nr:hypothetical protein [Actinomadura sp. NEAU-AAG7]MBT2213835.1 hypothetical protein [Actinomadura sp. NEAU-AAG7]